MQYEISVKNLFHTQHKKHLIYEEHLQARMLFSHAQFKADKHIVQ